MMDVACIAAINNDRHFFVQSPYALNKTRSSDGELIVDEHGKNSFIPVHKDGKRALIARYNLQISLEVIANVGQILSDGA